MLYMSVDRLGVEDLFDMSNIIIEIIGQTVLILSREIEKSNVLCTSNVQEHIF